MALKNYIAKSLYLEKVQKSIAHNNSKLTCNIYHIQVLSSPSSKRVFDLLQTDSGDEVLKSNQQRTKEDAFVLHCKFIQWHLELSFHVRVCVCVCVFSVHPIDTRLWGRHRE